ncbi:hypothetical protein LCL89_07170 [Halobacillus yeomjeoni]|uniref:hypothetical protein n=1 Tax=Halobacillus yeomjeoni TaxID=311194 RepID=UPI001CD46379|nr:hypothetical protein [Halobacillus yeomjeoni]MCA0983838.1 hypothetical protein [Halobacillus yeomjeoni]
MSKYIKILLLLLFLGAFGFSGGGYFLLFFIVPFEEWLVEIGRKQSEIDSTLKYFVFGWGLFGLLVTYVFYRWVVRKDRRALSYSITAFFLVNAGIVFYLFSNTNSALVALSQGEVQEATEQITFGPYPQKDDLLKLKEEGYDGVITLLNPTIVFENQLLKEEKVNGEEVGLSIHSYPMLPWVGDNKESLDGILNLVKENDGKKYYVHCYLGKHRVDYVKKLLVSATGIKAEKHAELLDDDFERGMVFTYDDSRIVLGPYPTDPEWFSLLRHEIKEIVTLLDSDSSLYEKEKKVAEENGIQFTPIDELEFSKDDIEQLAEYLQNTDHKIFLHGFDIGDRMLKLNVILNKGLSPIQENQLPASVTNVAYWLAVGNANLEPAALNKAGISNTVSYGTAPSADIVMNDDSIGEVYRVAQSIHSLKETTYVKEEGQLNQTSLLINMLNGFEYGIDESLDGTKVESGEINVISGNRKRFLGPVLNEVEWENHLLSNGVEHVVMVYAASVHTEEMKKQTEQLAGRFNLTFSKIDMVKGYEDELVKELAANDRTTYVITAEELKDLVKEVFK